MSGAHDYWFFGRRKDTATMTGKKPHRLLRSSGNVSLFCVADNISDFAEYYNDAEF